MPLDATGGRIITSLTDLLVEIGVTPVPMKDLEAHKIAQVRSHPPSFFNTAKPYLGFGLAAFAGAALATHNVWTAVFFALIVTGLSTFSLAIIFDTFRIKVRGRAKWIETHPFSEPMPEPVSKVMRHVRDRLPQARFAYGKLVQKYEVLDPYLVVELRADKPDMLGLAGQRACLGIWDDSGIIRIAAIDPTL